MSATSKLAGIAHLLDTRTLVTQGPDKGKHSGANADTVIKVLEVLREVVEELTPGPLDGAGAAPDPGTWSANAGEFAARWNLLSPADRERYWEYLRDAQQRSADCIQKDHEGLEQQLAGAHLVLKHAKREVRGLLDSLDDHVNRDEIYSAIKDVWETL